MADEISEGFLRGLSIANTFNRMRARGQAAELERQRLKEAQDQQALTNENALRDFLFSGLKDVKSLENLNAFKPLLENAFPNNPRLNEFFEGLMGAQRTKIGRENVAKNLANKDSGLPLITDPNARTPTAPVDTINQLFSGLSSPRVPGAVPGQPIERTKTAEPTRLQPGGISFGPRELSNEALNSFLSSVTGKPQLSGGSVEKPEQRRILKTPQFTGNTQGLTSSPGQISPVPPVIDAQKGTARLSMEKETRDLSSTLPGITAAGGQSAGRPPVDFSMPLPTTEELFPNFSPRVTTLATTPDGEVTISQKPKSFDELMREKAGRIEAFPGLTQPQRFKLYNREGVVLPKDSATGVFFKTLFIREFQRNLNDRQKKLRAETGKPILTQAERDLAATDAYNATAQKFGRIPEDFQFPKDSPFERISEVRNQIDPETGKVSGQSFFARNPKTNAVFEVPVSGLIGATLQATEAGGFNTPGQLAQKKARDDAKKQIADLDLDIGMLDKLIKAVISNPRGVGAAGDIAAFINDSLSQIGSGSYILLRDVLGLPVDAFRGTTPAEQSQARAKYFAEIGNDLREGFSPDGSIREVTAAMRFYMGVLSFRIARSLDPGGKVSDEDREAVNDLLGFDRIQSPEGLLASLGAAQQMLKANRDSLQKLLGDNSENTSEGSFQKRSREDAEKRKADEIQQLLESLRPPKQEPDNAR